MSARVRIVDNAYDADYKVYFCDSDYEQQNHQLLAGGQLVDSGENVKVCIVENQYDSDIKITRANFPRK